VLQGLPEAESRIDDYAVSSQAGRAAHLSALLQERFDLFHDVDVLGGQLHAPRVPLHMHEADGALGGDYSLQGALLGQGSDVIDHASAGRRSGPYHVRLASVDGDDRIRLSSQLLNDGYNAANLFLRIDGVGSGSRGLTAHVDDRCALFDHAQTMAYSGIDLPVLAAIGK
jgi:hypothetical protein